jgi:CRP/FNR family transcriptional regulator
MSNCQRCAHADQFNFCCLGPTSRTYLETHSTTTTYRRGATVFYEGTRAHEVYILCSGRVKLTSTSREGRTIILRIADAGDVLGLSAVFSHAQYEATAEVLEPCEVRVLQGQFLEQMLRGFSDAAIGVARALSADYRSAFDEARLVALPGSPAARLARLILDWAGDARRRGPNDTVRMTLTHDELASMTATTRETVTRTLSRFRRDKLISTQGISLTILQPRTLEQISAC